MAAHPRTLDVDALAEICAFLMRMRRMWGMGRQAQHPLTERHVCVCVCVCVCVSRERHVLVCVFVSVCLSGIYRTLTFETFY